MPSVCHSATRFANQSSIRHDRDDGRTGSGGVEMAEQAEAVRDVIVVGGGAAGLSAALTLARGQVVEVEVLLVAKRMVARAEVFAGIEIAPTSSPKTPTGPSPDSRARS
jgi:hypothetical protein